jgi:hypothetical protein
MAKVANAFTTYGAQANREDLSNAIYNIDPFDTPIMSMARRRNVTNRTFDWQTEHLPDTDEDNAQVEGFELERSAAQPTVRLTNVTQISNRDATVSGSQEASNPAGKRSEMAHQMAMKSKVLKSDMERILSGRQARVDGDDAATPTARRTEAVSHWIARAVDRDNVAGAAVVGFTTSGLPLTATDAFDPVAGVDQVEMTELLVGNAMEQAYNHGASPSMMVVPPAIKRTVSTFKGRETSQVLVGKTEVVATVDVIATDFGRIKVMPSRWIPGDVSLLLDPNYLALGYFRRFRQYPLARIGDAETRMILAEWGVEMRNPLAHILFNGVQQGAVIGQ